MTTEYFGTWTPQAPYGPQDEDDRDADRQILLDMQIPGGLDGTFIQDFTCTWFPKHGKEEEKKLWPQKDPDEGCKFWERMGRERD